VVLVVERLKKSEWSMGLVRIDVDAMKLLEVEDGDVV